MDAFYELSTSRQLGFAIGPIPFTAMVEYFNIFDLEDFDEFSSVIRQMDKVYLELNNEEVKNTGENRGNKPNASIEPNKKNSNKG